MAVPKVFYEESVVTPFPALQGRHRELVLLTTASTEAVQISRLIVQYVP
ncbi:hypothetical protein [Bradyrhizobium cenepequi]|nr:hypothetical protein [Bradyrhizobium cenepequi]MCA6109322.1 hypothetical protein [Bradyrhizobium cenepequi]